MFQFPLRPRPIIEERKYIVQEERRKELKKRVQERNEAKKCGKERCEEKEISDGIEKSEEKRS